MSKFLLLSLIVLTGCASGSKNLGNDINYQNETLTMKGYLSSVDDGNTKKPGILVVHEWWGHNEYARKRADMLAKEGYVALAVDMYGNGLQADHPSKANEFSSAVFKNMDEAKSRFMAALETLKAHPHVDKTKIAAIGYCFGGGVVLSMARMGIELDGVVSYHGSLKSPVKAKKGQIKGNLLVFNGAADPLVSKADIVGFKKEMKQANAKLEFVDFPGALHAFTNPGATELGAKFKLPLGYDKDADEKSWARTLSFFEEIF
ncbi:MAG: dienelactone hydrolase family protein [Bacteriovoracaceae bacterium]|nr:dienelactone hydrolase family protein [Bacteriovoracaceae bacterium]